MSFYLVNQPLKTKVYIPKALIVFISVFEITPSIRALVIIDSNSILRLYDLNGGQVLLQVRLLLNQQPLQHLLKTQAYQNVIMLISNNLFYFLNLDEIQNQVECLKKVGIKQVRKLKITKQSKDVSSSWFSIFNKDIKLMKKGQKICMKMGGRNKKIMKYCFGIFDHQNVEFKINSEWQSEFTFQYSISLESLANNFIIYQSYCNKGKPIKLSIAQCISSQDKKQQFLLSETTIIHFYEQISVVDVALLNEQVLCIFGNNSYQDIRSSLMIVYNIRQKCTLNYLNFKESSLQRIFWFMHPHYQFHYNHSLAQFDAVELGQKNSLIYQLYPQSYQTDQYFKIKGKVIQISKDFIFATNEDQLYVYPKLNKRAIYFKWMNGLGIYEIQCLTMIAQFLQ